MMKRIFVFLFAAFAIAEPYTLAQTTVVLAPIPQFLSLLQNGSPNAFGCVFSYASNTTTPLSTYTDNTGATLNTNPVILSSGGTANIWLAAGSSYTIKVVAYSGNVNCVGGSTLYTISGIGGGASVLTTNVPWSSTPQFIDQSQVQLFTIVLTGNTTALPLVVTGVTPPGLITFQITQDAVGNRTFTWPANMVGAAPIGLTANQITTQSFIWNGTTAIATGAAVTGNGPALSTGTITNTGNIYATGSISSSNQGTEISVANSSSGTTTGTLTILTGSPSQAQQAATSTVTGVQGICISGCGTSGTAIIQQSGTAACIFDNSTTANDAVVPSTTTGGDCHDSGSSASAGTQPIGTVTSTNGSAGTYSVVLAPNIFSGSTLGGTPTISSSSGWGTGAAVTISANSKDRAGQVSIVTGTGSLSSSPQIILQFSAPFPTVGFCALTGSGDNALTFNSFSAGGGGLGNINPITNKLVIDFSGTAAANTNYFYTYLCNGY
jgi:hypothetical protein